MRNHTTINLPHQDKHGGGQLVQRRSCIFAMSLVLILILVYKPLLLLTPFCPATLSTFSGFTTA